VAVLAALAGALCIGSADFMGGVAARRSHPLIATVGINLVALTLFLVAFAVVRPDLDTDAALGAVAGGVVSAVALCLIYASLAAGAMSLTAPLIACGSALVPTAAAIVLGDAPSGVQAAGIALVLVGIVTITAIPSRASDHVPLTRRALVLTAAASVVGGVAFAILLQAVEGGSTETALGVAGVSRLASTAVCLGLLTLMLRTVSAPRPPARPVAGAGVMEAAGTTCFLSASTLGQAAVTAVVVSLYAVVTVLLAQAVLRERVALHQGAGLAAAAAGVALLSAG
jgi:drug/metabolite transporter (DMT)-like permease